MLFALCVSEIRRLMLCEIVTLELVFSMFSEDNPSLPIWGDRNGAYYRSCFWAYSFPVSGIGGFSFFGVNVSCFRVCAVNLLLSSRAFSYILRWGFWLNEIIVTEVSDDLFTRYFLYIGCKDKSSRYRWSVLRYQFVRRIFLTSVRYD